MAKKTTKQLLAEWADYRTNLLDSTPVDPSLDFAGIEKHRLYLEQHPLEWIKFFFPKFASSEFADFHKKAIQRLLKNDEWYEVLSWSRELAKSTIVMFVVLYLVLTGKKKNVVLTSNSYDNALRLLEPYRAQLDTNQRIQAYYGEQVMYGNWEAGEFKTRSGASFRALGAGQSPRGTRNNEMRPDVILADDFDTDEDCLNTDTINKKWDWFEKALYPTRSISAPLLVIVCGNIIARDCCVVRAGAKADNWDIINIRDKNGVSSWAAKNSEEHIDRALSLISTKAAQGEYYNNPVSEGDIFKELTYADVPPLSQFRFLVAYADPSPSNNIKDRKNSTKALWLIGVLKGKFYIITGYLDRVTNDEFVDWFYNIEACVKARTQVYYYIENNSLQNPFFEQVFMPLFFRKGEERQHHIGITGDARNKPDKFSRIEGNLEPINKQGRLILNAAEKDNVHMKRLEEQFKLFSASMKAPADGPDCVEGGIFICNNKESAASIDSFKIGFKQTNTKRF